MSENWVHIGDLILKPPRDIGKTKDPGHANDNDKPFVRIEKIHIKKFLEKLKERQKDEEPRK